MKKYYSTKIVELGSMVDAFRMDGMIIMFNENAPEELRDYCALHRGNELNDTVTAGDIVQVGDGMYTIVYVGEQVQKNLKDLGHICLRFNGNADNESMEGSIYLEKEDILPFVVNDEIAFYKP